MNIKEQIETIVKLQLNITESNRVQEQLNGVSGRIAKIEAELTTFSDSLAAVENERDALKKEYRAYEGDVQVNAARLSKSQERLMAVKTNKEYQSTLKEIDELKAKTSRLEDEMLECLERIEDAERSLREKKAALATLKREAEEEKAQVEQAAANDRERFAVLEGERQVIAGASAPDLLERFENARQRGNGLAIAPVEEAVCQGCHMNIPPQLYNDLYRFAELLHCPHCQRIIYLKETA